MPQKDDTISDARDDARRLKVDDDIWLVYEMGPGYDRRGSSLVFESEHLVRRVRAYPPHWRDLPDADLASLMDQL